MPASSSPVLYTFRRCPYAIRARLAIAVSGCAVSEIEVALREKPPAMLAISPKGTVPVLHLPDGRVLDESLDIMRWALALSDPEHWLPSSTAFADARIAENDTSFKQALDRYKYAPRFPEHPAEYYRDQACEFIEKLENKLGQSAHLQGGARGFTDAAIFPFVRQFAGVESNWFAQSRYREVNRWLSAWLDSPLFARVMQKN